MARFLAGTLLVTVLLWSTLVAASPKRGTRPLHQLAIGGEQRIRVTLTSQGSPFQVAPGGQSMALLISRETGLCLLGRDGREQGCDPRAIGPFAFSADGNTLGYASSKGVFAWDVITGDRRRLSGTRGVDGLAWSADGVVVRFRAVGRHRLVVLDTGGEKRIGAAKSMDAFAAAGTTIVYVRSGPVCMPDCQPLADTQRVVHAAVSPDGERVAFATQTKVYLRGRDGTTRLLDQLGGIHSLAFSATGACLLWASAARGGLLTPTGIKRLPGSSSARFRSDARGLILAGEDGAATWAPATGTKTIVGGLGFPDGHTLAADMLADKPVVYYVRLPTSVKEHAPVH